MFSCPGLHPGSLVLRQFIHCLLAQWLCSSPNPKEDQAHFKHNNLRLSEDETNENSEGGKVPSAVKAGRLHGGGILTQLQRMRILSFRERLQKLKRKCDYRVSHGVARQMPRGDRQGPGGQGGFGQMGELCGHRMQVQIRETVPHRSPLGPGPARTGCSKLGRKVSWLGQQDPAWTPRCWLGASPSPCLPNLASVPPSVKRRKGLNGVRSGVP